VSAIAGLAAPHNDPLRPIFVRDPGLRADLVASRQGGTRLGLVPLAARRRERRLWAGPAVL